MQMDLHHKIYETRVHDVFEVFENLIKLLILYIVFIKLTH